MLYCRPKLEVLVNAFPFHSYDICTTFNRSPKAPTFVNVWVHSFPFPSSPFSHCLSFSLSSFIPTPPRPRPRGLGVFKVSQWIPALAKPDLHTTFGASDESSNCNACSRNNYHKMTYYTALKRNSYTHLYIELDIAIALAFA